MEIIRRIGRVVEGKWKKDLAVKRDITDVKMAFLNGKLEEEIYMKQSTGFDDGSGQVCKFKRAIYGLKQAENAWNKEWNRAMEDLGYRQLKTNYCCYIRWALHT